MGIFSEDLINFGNLLDTEIELKLTPQDLKTVFKDLDFDIEDGLLKVKRKIKKLLFSKTVEARLREESRSVYNDREREIRAITVISLSKLEDFKDIVSLDGDRAVLNLWEVIKNTELYKKIPKQFRERVVISRYMFKKGYIQLYLKVEK